jgi:hypothetical protein
MVEASRNLAQPYSNPERETDPQPVGNVIYIPTEPGTRARLAIITAHFSV